MKLFKEKAHRLTDPYVTAGNRLYVIGTQDGGFPDVGGHIEGEMYGVWNHPIKLLDGFFIGVRDEDTTSWPTAHLFRTYPFYTEHHYREGHMTIVRRQFVPDNDELLFVTLEVANTGNEAFRSEILFAIKSDLRPGWLGEEVDGDDVVQVHGNALLFTDSSNPWAVAARSDWTNQRMSLDGQGCPAMTKGNGTYGTVVLPISCPPGESVTVRIGIAGSVQGVQDVASRLEHGMRSHDSMWQVKQRRYEALANTSKIMVPDEDINDTSSWVKFNTDWLVRNVPGVGNGLGAGLPEYPWWFGCDNGYALQGVLAMGGFEVAKDTLRLLASVSDRTNGNGRIIHEVSSTNVVFNPGNTQETPQFCMTVWQVFTWTGDLGFLREMYPFVRTAIDWTLSMAPDGDDLAVGYGIMEVENLNAKLIDTAVYTQEALKAYAQMAEVLGDLEVARAAASRADQLRTTLLERFWLPEEGLYADVLVDGQGMNQHLDLWAEKQGNAGHTRAAAEYRSMIRDGATGEHPYLLKNWVISTPVEVGIAPTQHADRLLARMRTPEFRGTDGLYLSGIDQTHMMTISTSVQAVAECRYGHVDEALAWLRQICGTRDLRMPGSISEMSPDYGCFVQAWTVYGVMVPVVSYFFGIHPVAHQNRCRVNMQMPTAWQNATLENLHVGTNRITLQFERTGNGQCLTIHSDTDWTFEFPHPVEAVEARSTGTTHRVDGGTSTTFRYL